jgi:hypothetical protein
LLKKNHAEILLQKKIVPRKKFCRKKITLKFCCKKEFVPRKKIAAKKIVPRKKFAEKKSRRNFV